MKRLTANETVKAQSVRIADVVLIGPLMIWGGSRAIPKNPVAGLALAFMGMGTIVYNWVNYLKIQNLKQ